MAAFIRGLDVHPRSDKTDGTFTLSLKMSDAHTLCIVVAPFIIERYLQKGLEDIH